MFVINDNGNVIIYIIFLALSVFVLNIKFYKKKDKTVFYLTSKRDFFYVLKLQNYEKLKCSKIVL